MRRPFVFCPCIVVFFLGCSQGGPRLSARTEETWRDYENPESFDDGSDYVTALSELPAKGETSMRPWVSSHWPDVLGGIAFRWNMQADSDRSFFYRPPTELEARALSLESLKELSPAEKFDIYTGRFDYPTVHLAQVFGSPILPYSAGVCDGVAAAAANIPEPGPVMAVGASGITVPFGSSDLKGLVATYHARVSRFDRTSLGRACRGTAAGTDECRDVNAGAFHLVLANEMGLRQKMLIADLEWDYEQWNHVLYQYEAEFTDESLPVSAAAAIGTVREVAVKLRLVHTRADVKESWEPLPLEENSDASLYRYTLELDKDSRIIGGRWKSYAHPDFVWRPALKPYEGDWKALEALVKVATGAVP